MASILNKCSVYKHHNKFCAFYTIREWHHIYHKCIFLCTYYIHIFVIISKPVYYYVCLHEVHSDNALWAGHVWPPGSVLLSVRLSGPFNSRTTGWIWVKFDVELELFRTTSETYFECPTSVDLLDMTDEKNCDEDIEILRSCGQNWNSWTGLNLIPLKPRCKQRMRVCAFR